MFSLFNKRNSKLSKRTENLSKRDSLLYDNTVKADIQIAELQKADEQYQEDGDLGAITSVYERVLDLEQPLLWNSFNYCLTLVDLYLKDDRRDDAWRFLNQMSLTFAKFPAYESNLGKIRNEQFKILKIEKRYKDALLMLALSRFLNSSSSNGAFFDEDKFVKNAKVVAGNAGLSPEGLCELSQLISDTVKKKNASEDDIIALYRNFTHEKGI